MIFPLLTRCTPRSPAVWAAVFALTCGLALTGTAPAHAATLELAGPDGARLIINDESMSYLPLRSPLQLPAGTYVINCELPGYVPYETTVVLTTDDWLRLRIRMTPLSRKTAWSANLPVAGLGQFYMGKTTKGWLFLLGEAGGLLTAAAGELQRSDYRKDYLLFKDRYDSALDANDITRYRRLSAQAYQDMEDAESLRNTGLLVAGVAVLLSVADAIFLFPEVEAGPGPVPPVVGWNDGDVAQPAQTLTTVHAGLRLSF